MVNTLGEVFVSTVGPDRRGGAEEAKLFSLEWPASSRRYGGLAANRRSRRNTLTVAPFEKLSMSFETGSG